MKDKTKKELIEELNELRLENERLRRLFDKLPDEVKLDKDIIIKLLKAVNTTSDAIFLTAIDGIITYINSGFTLLYGFTSEEVVGKVTPRIIKSGLLDQEVYKDFWATLNNKDEVKGEILNKRKNGEVVYIDGTASPIFDKNNEIIGFLGIQRDITSRKREEDKLRNKMAENQKLMDSMLKRDFKMIELKKEVNELLRSSGQKEKYMVI